LRLWKHATENVALWSIYDSKPAGTWPQKKSKVAAFDAWGAPVIEHNAKLAKEILDAAVNPTIISPPPASSLETAEEIFSPEPVEEPSEPLVNESVAVPTVATCSNCGSVDALLPARDRDGLRGVCCGTCLSLPTSARDFG